MTTINGTASNPRSRFKLHLPSIQFCLVVSLGILCLYSLVINNQMDHVWESQLQATTPLDYDDVHMEEWREFQRDYYLRYRRHPPDSLRTWLQYAKYYNCNERDFYNDIEEDLRSYRNQVNRTGRLFNYNDIVASGMKQTDNYIAFQLENQDLTVVASHNVHLNFVQQAMIEKQLRWILRPLLAHDDGPPIKSLLFFDLHDHPSLNTTHESMPIFTVCKMGYMTEDKQPPADTDLPTFVDDSFSNALDKLHKYTRQVQFHSAFHKDFPDSYDCRAILVPYHFGLFQASSDPQMLALKDRKDAIVWRGSTTGYDWGLSPRFRLIERYGGIDAHPIAPQVPVIADFAFVDIVQNYTSQLTMSPHWRMAPRMEPDQARLYKYIMDVDGNSFTSRFPGLLRSGSVIFKSTRFREWFSERLRPFVDYVPVNYNLSDLVEKVKWVHEHPDMAERIAQHGKEMSTHHIRDEDMRCYTYRLILEYHALFENW